MASRRKKVAKAVPFNAADLASITKANPYLQRLIEDAELRDNVRTALDSGKNAASRLSSAKAPQKALIEDKKLQNELRSAAEAIRDAAMALSDAPKHSKPKKKSRLGRKLMLLVAGAVIALVLSEGLRSKVLDTLFGAEEEFQYTPPVGTPAPPPASTVSAA
jgi:type IV secretory pathway VirB10-like protein